MKVVLIQDDRKIVYSAPLKEAAKASRGGWATAIKVNVTLSYEEIDDMIQFLHDIKELFPNHEIKKT